MYKPIGGYFELELRNGCEYYNEAIKLNSARNCLAFVVKERKYKRILLPYYICEEVVHALQKNYITFDFYHINEKLEPVIEEIKQKDTALLYVNYFGIKSDVVEKLIKSIDSIIVDNAQAFFSKALAKVDTYYSPRKFFGVPDGGYLLADINLNTILERDYSLERAGHLIKRLEYGPEAGFNDFRLNEDKLKKLSIKRMSKLTEMILKNIDYEFIKKTRNDNFMQLHYELGAKNLLDINVNIVDGPMVYPYFTDDRSLKKRLSENKIYVATYWEFVFKMVQKNSFEFRLAENLLPLPVDQRYGSMEMDMILSIIDKKS